MDRKEFIKTCSFSCLGMLGLTALVEGCTPTKYVQATKTGNKLQVARADFANGNKWRRSIIIRSETMSHPIVLYRFSDTGYSALLLQCTHQNNELNVNGDLLTCPAHGSEFTNRGEVVQGPADRNLKSFPVSTEAGNIYIHLE